MSANEHRERLERNSRANGEAIRSAERVTQHLDRVPAQAERAATRAIRGIRQLARDANGSRD